MVNPGDRPSPHHPFSPRPPIISTRAVTDATLSVEQVADIIQPVSQTDPQAALQGVEDIGRDWL